MFGKIWDRKYVIFYPLKKNLVVKSLILYAKRTYDDVRLFRSVQKPKKTSKQRFPNTWKFKQLTIIKSKQILMSRWQA